MGSPHHLADAAVTAAHPAAGDGNSSKAATAPARQAPIIAQADDLAAVGELRAVAALLRPTLAHVTAGLANADTAAVLYAYALAGTGHPAAASAWARWAHTHHHHGPGHPTTLHALGVLAAALLADNHPRRSAACYRDLIAALPSLHSPTSDHILAARADRASALHRAGSCAAAHNELTGAWHTRRAHAGDSNELTLPMLIRLAGMYRDCADTNLATYHYWHGTHPARGQPEPLRHQVQHAASHPPRPEHRALCTYQPPRRTT
ncbi:hypothetical protein AB0H28_14355 [Micromonospora sp. NPDC050980]|uniref:hypothetical protein n=1 Tax=Micromonospora sp. NPDC050980 TaxID=3155161 RepID=UPI0033CEB9F0